MKLKIRTKNFEFGKNRQKSLHAQHQSLSLVFQIMNTISNRQKELSESLRTRDESRKSHLMITF